MHPDHRRKIRVAVRLGVEVKFGRDQVACFARLHARCFEGSGIRVGGDAYYQELYDVLASANHVHCAVVYHRGVPMGGAFVPYTRYAGYYLAGGSAAEVEPSGAIKLLHWEIIKRLRAEGVAKYDFLGARLSSVQGTKLEFIQRFKARFGCELQRGYLWKLDVRRGHAMAWDAMHRANAWLKGRPPAPPDIIDQERAKANANGSLIA
jgi:lipid II:glycine glycyltransferase (peptidoglycan interpeptide bridge formation enzyme)